METQEEPSLLDIFAALALIGVTASTGTFKVPIDIARESYDIAEAMIVEREKRKECTQK